MPPSRLQNASKTPSRRSKIDLKTFIHASPVSTSLFDRFFSIRTTLYEHSKYKHQQTTMIFTLFHDCHSWPQKRRSHANPFWNVSHAPFENESKFVSYTNESPLKLTNVYHIAFKTWKTSLWTPQNVSNMLPRRVQNASKPLPTRLDTARKPRRCS